MPTNKTGSSAHISEKVAKYHFLKTIAFVSGMSIMALEITAARLLAPYFGTSQLIWTNIIGVVMLALTCGYYFGGKLADKKPYLHVLLKRIFISGLLFLIIPWLVGPISSFATVSTLSVNSGTIVLFIGSLLATVLLFAYPIYLLGMVSPFIIRLHNIQKEHLGEVTGSISAFSTVGSLIGTFLPTLFFIPLIGSRLTMTFFASILILISLLGFGKKHLKVLAICLIILSFFGPQTFALKSSGPKVIAQTESPYQFIQVQEGHKGRFLVYNEGGGIQSVYYPDQILTGTYYDYMTPLLYNFDKDQIKKAAIIGLAGGTISRQIDYFFGDKVLIDGIEIDKKVTKLAEKYFDISQKNLKIYNEDGVIFLKKSDQKYDFIVVDAYSNQLYIPWTMTTVEFWKEIKNSLTENGIVAINVNAISSEHPLLKSISNTMASVFPHTYITQIGSDGSWNYMVSASNSEINFQKMSADNLNGELITILDKLLQNTQNIKFDPTIRLLTNDWAPVDMMTDKMILDYISN